MADPSLAPGRTRLYLLGRVELVSPQGESLTAEITQPKRQALLAYLAGSPGTFHRRDTLLALLWPDMDGERSRRALRAALHYLRHALGPGVLVGRGQEEVGLDPDRIAVDVWEFEAALERGDEERALTLFTGDFLPGLHVSDASEFQSWMDAERRSLRRRAVQAALTASAKAWEVGDVDAALTSVRRGVEIDPFDEGATRHLVELLARSGDRTGAVRALDRFAARLEEELELPLSAEMDRLGEEIRNGQTEVVEPLSERTAPPVQPGSGPEGGAPASRPAPTRRSRGRTTAALGIGGVALAVIGLSWTVGSGGGEGGAVALSAEPSFHDRRVVIAPFENRTGDPSLDVVGRAAADWTAQGLMGTGMVEVVSPAEVLRSVQVLEREEGSAPAPGAAMTLAEQTRSRILVSGSYHRAGDSLVFQARISDAAEGTVLRAVEPVRGDGDDHEALMTALRGRIIGSLATVLDPRLASWSAAASQPPSFEAYRLYAEGLDLFLEGDFPEAERRLHRAWTLDTTFTAPLIWALYACANRSCKDPPALFGYLAYLSAHRDSMAPWDRAMTDHVVAHFNWNWDAAVEAAYRVLDYAPDSEWAYKLAYAAVRANRPREAIEVLSRIEPDRGWMREWRGYWGVLGTAYHLSGNYEKELETARAGQARFGANRYKFYEIRALMASARVDAALEVAQRSRYESRSLIDEFRAHGYASEGDTLARWMLRWRQHAGDTIPRGRTAVQEYGMLMALAGEHDRAAEILEAASADVAPGEHWVEWLRHAQILGELGTLQARWGERERSTAILDRLTTNPSPDVLARGQKRIRQYRFWQAARVARALGEDDDAVHLLRRAVESGIPHTYAHRYFYDLRYHPEARDLFRARD